jgi:energy-coupling factor transport system ATP-binding protein
MAGLLKPLTGTIDYNGFSAERGAVVISFQHPERQFFLETVEKELRFGPENLGLNGIEQIAAESYGIIGLPREKFAQRDPFTLSGGEKRRLAFGTIISMQPSFIFFDEPTCALDGPGIDVFKKIVRQLKNSGLGILIVSHNGDIIFELAEKIISLDKGKIKCRLKREDFFREEDYSRYLSTPEAISYQLEKFGRIKFYSESELLADL